MLIFKILQPNDWSAAIFFHFTQNTKCGEVRFSSAEPFIHMIVVWTAQFWTRWLE